MAQLIDGRAISADIRTDVQRATEAWREAGHRPPFLGVVLIGDNPASASYVRGKEKAAREVGIESKTYRFGDDISEGKLLAVIAELNEDDAVDGILVQLPLPPHIDEEIILRAVRPSKDVDGFHPHNVGALVLGQEGFQPATPSGIIELLDRSQIPTEGRRAVVIGRSNIVGKPMANLLVQRGTDATVTICHSRTRDLPEITRQADILVVAAGRPAFITADMVKKGAAVIDVGINRVDDSSRERGYRLVGDVDFEAVREKAGWITPVPGGVGPVTIAMLLKSTLRAAQHAAA